ncbi:TPA: glycosyltransferase [Enterococcus faecium]
MNLPDYSFLLSVYDKENPSYLDECLKSVFEQSHPSNDIVLVIDGPINIQLKEIIRKFECETLNLVYLEENVGLGDALRIGLEACKNEFILRMDTDDICHPYRAEKQVSFLASRKDVSAVGTPVLEFEDTIHNVTGKKEVPIEYKDVKLYSRYRNPICHPSVAFRKKNILIVGNYERLLLFEDYYLWLKLISNDYVVENIEEPLVWMRVDSNLYKRRGGISYIKKHYNFRKKEKKLGMINEIQFFQIVFVQSLIAIIPNDLRLLFYKKILRRT